MMVDLPYPHKVLWPNGRTKSQQYLYRLRREHKTWAFSAAGAGTKRLADAPSKIVMHVSPLPKGPEPDRDNIIAACKYYLDGIALATGVNDRNFSAPEVIFTSRTRYGGIVIEVTQSGLAKG